MVHGLLRRQGRQSCVDEWLIQKRLEWFNTGRRGRLAVDTLAMGHLHRRGRGRHRGDLDRGLHLAPQVPEEEGPHVRAGQGSPQQRGGQCPGRLGWAWRRPQPARHVHAGRGRRRAQRKAEEGEEEMERDGADLISSIASVLLDESDDTRAIPIASPRRTQHLHHTIPDRAYIPTRHLHVWRMGLAPCRIRVHSPWYIYLTSRHYLFMTGTPALTGAWPA